MIIDGSSISNNKSVKALIEVEKSLMINICNALLIHQRKPIFIFHQNSYISIINCTIINSQFNFIAELITISSSQIKILNCTLTNVIFNKTSLITSFQSLTEMIDINIHSSCFLDCSLINNVDGTFSFKKFSIINSTGYTSNIFDSVGTVYFMADDFILYNLSFQRNKLCSSFIFHSDFASELIIKNFSILYCNGIDIFNGICNIFELNYGFVYESFFYNQYIINAVKSKSISIMNTSIQNCVCNSIVGVNRCSSFIFCNSIINNVTNTDINIINHQNQNNLKKQSPLFEISKVTANILINSTSFLNIFNQNAAIFSIHESSVFFNNVVFENIQLDYSSCCIISDESSNLLISHSRFPHPKSSINNVMYYPIYADGLFSVQNVSLVSNKRRLVLDCQNIILNNENKCCNRLVFVLLFAFQIILFVFIIITIFCNIDHHRDQYELLISNQYLIKL